MPDIKSICLDFPNDLYENGIYYCVGQIDKQTELTITKIMEDSYCCGDGAIHMFYKIYSDNKLIAEMHQYGHIVYVVD